MNELYSFDLSTDKWTNLSLPSHGTPPSPRSFHKMVSIGNMLFVFGGCGKEGRLSDLHSYNTDTKTWTELPSFENISGRGGAGFVVSADSKSLFIVGGFSGKEMNDVFRYDIESKVYHEVYAQDNDKLRPFSVSCGGVLNG